KGIEKGIEKGKKSEKIAIAKEMKNKNMNIELIRELTGLSIEDIEEL
ncbi:ATPase, partial [Brachyspira hampsonii]|nr:ATPase [Brachyspira hampsonii]